MTRRSLSLIALCAASLLGPAAFAQSAPPKPAPPAAPPPAVNTTRPAGSMIRCVDGTWAPKGGTPAACDAHKGMAYRYPEVTAPPAAKARPDAGITKLAPPPAPQSDVAPPPVTASRALTASAKAVTPPPPPPTPPANATVVCKDGTFLSGERVASRCDAHGGLTAFLPQRRP